MEAEEKVSSRYSDIGAEFLSCLLNGGATSVRVSEVRGWFL